MKHCFLVLALLVLPAAAQEQKQHFTINVGTPEGQLLQAIGTEPDDDKKALLCVDFLDKYPKHEGAGWVTAQLQAVYVKEKDFDKAIEAGEKALVNDPNNLDVAYYGVKAAEGKEDPALVKTWATRTFALAHKEMATFKAPADEDEKLHQQYVKDVNNYAGYAVYATALKIRDPKEIADLGATLEQQDIKSQYMPQLSGTYLNALSQSGQAGKMCPTAEKLAAANSKDGEALLAAASCSLQRQKFEAASAHATRAIEAINARSKPEGVSDADWASKRAAQLGRANYVAGVAYGAQSRFGPADKALRVALPSLKGDSASTAVALFYLGLSNYNLGKAIGDKSRIREGLHYFEQCAEISSSVQAQANNNIRIIKGELGVK